jgi:uncharacterized protein YcbX
MPHLSRILLYPIKALDGLTVDQTTILPGGSLQWDRQWAMVDDQGNFVNGKGNVQVHRLRCQFDLTEPSVAIQPVAIQSVEHSVEQGVESPPPVRFSLEAPTELTTWLSHYFGFNIQLQQNHHQGFPDDTNSPGPTLLADQTLTQVAQWFGSDPEEIRRRFRANLEIADVPPFWEDQLFGPEETPVRFRIGDIECWGINPCLRCIVPTRDPWTGQGDRQFAKRFMTQRQAQLPDWTVKERFKNPYRLSVNTQIPATEAGKVLRVGDTIEILK